MSESSPQGWRSAVTLARSVLGAFVLCVVLVGGCKEGEDEGGRDCVESSTGCAGISQTTLSGSTWYTEGATCATVLYVREGAAGGDGSQSSPFADLPEAAAVAVAGDCIALAAGAYQGATIPGTVSLLGVGSELTTVGPLLVIGGSDALIRGVQVNGDDTGIEVQAAQRLRVEEVLVLQTARMGVFLDGGSQITLRNIRVAQVSPHAQDATPVGNGVVSVDVEALVVDRVLVEGNEGNGLVHFGGSIEITGSVFRENRGYGVAVGCSLSGSCATPPLVSVQDNQVLDNLGVGLWLAQVEATVERNLVSGTGMDVMGLARNIEAAWIQNLIMRDNVVQNGEGFGVLLTATSGELDGDSIIGHLGRGVWVQNPEGLPRVNVWVTGADIRDNHQVGLGVLGPCDLEVQQSQVVGTRLGVVLVGNTTIEQGDGMQAVVGASLVVQAVTFEGNERTAVMADLAQLVDVQNCTFGEEQTEGAIVISRTDAGQINTLDNTGPGGVPVAPEMPPDPLEYDAESEMTYLPYLAF